MYKLWEQNPHWKVFIDHIGLVVRMSVSGYRG